jgi:hypothetical protein
MILKVNIIFDERSRVVANRVVAKEEVACVGPIEPEATA